MAGLITRQGDMVDLICWRIYGTTTMAEAVYQANPGLAARGPMLPAGIPVTLPVKEERAERATINLWD